MASKSKKRRRVLGASCILAALIIAGSSFAWFTSKDEVTNRLTANSDYGVSIVESFAPPANWLPGQEINKDVYAVNTGNIAAFVKEELSGVLDYSYETKVSKFEADKCVKLLPMATEKIDGATTNEAGSFLAWTDVKVKTVTYTIDGADVVPGTNDDTTYTVKVGDYYAKSLTEGENKLYTRTGGGTADFPYEYTEEATKKIVMTTTETPVATGFVNSARNEDVANGDAANAWHPTETGHYIFRRAITDATTDNPQFTYAGYYFVKAGDVEGVTEDTYYKIIIGDDNYRAANDGTTPLDTDDDGSVRYEFDIIAKQGNLKKATVDPETGAVTYAPIAIDADGSFEDTPVISYVKVVDLDPQYVSFTYDDGTATPDEYGNGNKYEGAPYLKVRYNNASGDLSARDGELKTAKENLAAAKAALIEAQESAASTTQQLADLEVKYRNAEYDYYTAQSRYDKTKADMDYANALIEETNKLYEPALARANVENQMNLLKQKMEEAAKAVKDEANIEQGDTEAGSPGEGLTAMTDNYNAVKAAMTNATNGIGSGLLINGTIRNLINNNQTAPTYHGGSDLTAAKQNLAVFDSIWKQINGDPAVTGDTGILGKISADYDKYDSVIATGNPDTDTDPAILDREASGDVAQGYLQDLTDDLKTLETLLKQYAAAYNNFTTDTAVQSMLTQLQAGTRDVSAIEVYSKGTDDANGKINKLQAKANDTDDGGLKQKIAEYDTAYHNYYNYMTPTGTYYTAVNNWNTAVSTYNTNVNGDNNDDSAKAKYDAAVLAVQPTKNMAIDNTTITDATGEWTLVNDGLTLVNGFSAHSVGNVTAADEAANGSNLRQRDAGAGSAVSKITTDTAENNATSNADPRITGADTNYLKYVLTNTSYNSANDFDETTNNPYKQMTKVDEFNTASDAEHTEEFFQLNADPSTDAKQKLSALNTAIGDGTSDGKLKDYNTAKQNYETEANKDATKAVLENLAAKAKDVEDAQAAVDAATIAQATQNASGLESNIAIDVVLDKAVVKSSEQASATGATWVFDEDTNGTKTPTFYYNRILDPAATSEKLVDKLVFCDSVKASDFKDLQFDLNVALDSMQVTYDPRDNVTLTATGVNASEDFDMTATIDDQTTKALTWADKVAPATVYKVGDTVLPAGVTKLTNETQKTVGNTTYNYSVSYNGDTYYGTDLPQPAADGTPATTVTFYKINTSVTPNTLVTGEGSSVVVTAE